MIKVWISYTVILRQLMQEGTAVISYTL